MMFFSDPLVFNFNMTFFIMLCKLDSNVSLGISSHTSGVSNTLSGFFTAVSLGSNFNMFIY